MSEKTIVRESSEPIRNLSVGLNASKVFPVTVRCGSARCPDAEYWFTPAEALKIAAELTRVTKALEDEAKRVTVADIVDGAVFYADGDPSDAWRKVIELHKGRFMVVDRTGLVQCALTSAADVLDLAQCCGYRKEKRA